jgi:cob(I)alamin adenosyltransferase
MSFKIYTKTGDKGQTSLWGGARVAKHHIRIESYGTVDELNSYLGVVASFMQTAENQQFIYNIQSRLFTIGAILATQPDKKNLQTPDLHTEDISALETAIDQMESELEPLKNFILPSGHLAVSHCHVARCICRRAERLVVGLEEAENQPIEPLVLQYLNRLSDYLFVLARKMAKDLQVTEVIWQGRK